MRKVFCLVLCTLLVACASQPSAPPVPPVSSAAPGADDPVRALPRGVFPHGIPTDLTRNWYPAEARQQRLTGRAVVEFRIGAAGKPQDVKVYRAEADPILQSAALQMANTFRFDVKDPAFNPTDQSVYRISVSYQLMGCGLAPVPPYPGYDKPGLAWIVSGDCRRR